MISVWDLSPYVHTANTARSETLIRWAKVPQGFVPAVKLILYRYWMVGRPGGIRPTAKSVVLRFYAIARFLRWVSTLGAQRLADISPLHCMGWVQHCRERKLAPRSQKAGYMAVETLYTFRDHHGDALRGHPWPESSARRLAGIGALDDTSPSTKLIPPPIVERVFQGALALIDRADTILDRRNSRTPSGGYDPELLLLRSACYVILGLTSGCRNHELASIEVGAIRQTTHDGEVFYWLKGHSLKTHCGATEWMVPEIAARCVQILERWATPLQAELCRQLASIGRRLSSTRHDTREHTALLIQQQKLKADRHRLFLGRSNSTGVGCLSLSQWNKHMRSFAVHVGVDWPLSTHQFRRTFAANVANHVLGDLIYLKHHYKHWSIDMTALYALNTQQEQELFDEVLQAVREKKIRIVEHWLDDDCMVIGGATGVKAFKAKHRLETVATRKKLAEDTADLVNIRATGHGWCLASDAGCGGQGLYEPTRCLDCRNGVIDSSHVPVWKNILVQQRELLVSAADCGPSGSRRIQRDLAHAEQVLGDLGITVEDGDA